MDKRETGTTVWQKRRAPPMTFQSRETRRPGMGPKGVGGAERSSARPGRMQAEGA